MLVTTILLHPFVSPSLSRVLDSVLPAGWIPATCGARPKQWEGGSRAFMPGRPRWQKPVSIKPNKVICERGLAGGEVPTPHLSNLKTHGLSTEHPG